MRLIKDSDLRGEGISGVLRGEDPGHFDDAHGLPFSTPKATQKSHSHGNDEEGAKGPGQIQPSPEHFHGQKGRDDEDENRKGGGDLHDEGGVAGSLDGR